MAPRAEGTIYLLIFSFLTFSLANNKNEANERELEELLENINALIDKKLKMSAVISFVTNRAYNDNFSICRELPLVYERFYLSFTLCLNCHRLAPSLSKRIFLICNKNNKR
ncbi:hypothetical protein E4V51_03225 [Paenibacillus sp. 28ISP30-2]|nr:hypothetical protein [Paenibacillus sp. 28ISP30-2]